MIFKVIFWLSNIKVMNFGDVIFTFQFEYHKLWNLCKISIFCLNSNVKSSNQVWIFKEKSIKKCLWKKKNNFEGLRQVSIKMWLLQTFKLFYCWSINGFDLMFGPHLFFWSSWFLSHYWCYFPLCCCYCFSSLCC